MLDLLLLEGRNALQGRDVRGDELERVDAPRQLRPEEGDAAAEGLLCGPTSALVLIKGAQFVEEQSRWHDRSERGAV